jgi:hypothetical protein
MMSHNETIQHPDGRVDLKAGHMMYIDEKSLVRMRADIGKFIQDSMNR